MKEKGDVTTIQLNKSIVKALKRIKKYPRETYGEVIINLIKTAGNMTEYDEFLHKSQQAKMRELWEKGDYKEWESA
ncbi:MAG: hypothetical protein ACP5MZ_01885 [Candidatus Micrarchaeia archaeon]